MASKWLEEIRNLAKKSEDPALDALTKMGDHVENTLHEMDKRVDSAIDETNKAVKSVSKDVERLRTSQDAGFDLIGDKMEAMAKRQAISGRAFIQDVTNDLVEAIPTEKRHLIHLAERTMGSSKNPRTGDRITEKGRMADPVFKTAAALWFTEASKIQLGNRFKDTGRSRENLTKLEAAFAASYTDLTTKAISDMAEDSNPSGGFLVPAPVEAEVMRLIEDNGVMRPLVRKIPMTAKTLSIPTKGNAITAYIASEGGTLTRSYDQTAFASATLTAKKFIGRTTMSIELLEDSIVGLLPYIQTTLAEEIAILEDQEALEGAGTNFTGVIAATGVNSVATTTTDGEALVYGDLVSTVFKARERASRRNARWFMSPEIFAKIISLVDTGGMPIVQYSRVPNEILPTVLGFPVETMSTLSITITRGATGGTSNVYFGPPEAIIFGDRMGIRWDVSDAPNWATYEMDARLVKRTGIVVAVPSSLTKLVGAVA